MKTNFLNMIVHRAKNWKTTTAGLVLFVVSTVLVYIGKATITECSPLLLMGVSLFISHDELFLKNFMMKQQDELNTENNDERNELH